MTWIITKALSVQFPFLRFPFEFHGYVHFIQCISKKKPAWKAHMLIGRQVNGACAIDCINIYYRTNPSEVVAKKRVYPGREKLTHAVHLSEILACVLSRSQIVRSAHYWLIVIIETETGNSSIGCFNTEVSFNFPGRVDELEKDFNELSLRRKSQTDEFSCRAGDVHLVMFSFSVDNVFWQFDC